jgi:hypothetical protein
MTLASDLAAYCAGFIAGRDAAAQYIETRAARHEHGHSGSVIADVLRREAAEVRDIDPPPVYGEPGYVNTYEGPCLNCGHVEAHTKKEGAGCTVMGCECMGVESRAKFIAPPQQPGAASSSRMDVMSAWEIIRKIAERLDAGDDRITAALAVLRKCASEPAPPASPAVAAWRALSEEKRGEVLVWLRRADEMSQRHYYAALAVLTEASGDGEQREAKSSCTAPTPCAID